MSNETNTTISEQELIKENQRLNNILAGFEKVLQSTNEHYDGVRQSLVTISESVNALTLSIEHAQKDCDSILQILRERREAIQEITEAGVQKRGTG